MARRYVIVGGGIIGSYSALHILENENGASVTLIDRDPFAYDNASCGNMGGFATCEVRPLSTIANIFRALGWMVNPLAPFTLRPTSISGLTPWILRFVRAAFTPGHFQHVVDAQQALMSRSYEAHLRVIGGTHLARLISEDGALLLYKNEKRLLTDWETRWRIFRDQGEVCSILTEADLRCRLPALSTEISNAIYVPSIKHWKSPATLLRGLHDRLQDRGARIVRGEVRRIECAGNVAERLVFADDSKSEFDHLTIAAGAWSKTLCKDVGDPVPLASERGYSTSVRGDELGIRNLLLFPDDEFVATPMEEGLRLGGTVELASLDAAPNFERSDLLANIIKDYFPGLDTRNRDEWMGHRPSSPDGLPVIGNSPSCRNVSYAFGHGHVGVTQAAISGRLISQLATGTTPEIDVAPYSIGRFA